MVNDSLRLNRNGEKDHVKLRDAIAAAMIDGVARDASLVVSELRKVGMKPHHPSVSAELAKMHQRGVLTRIGKGIYQNQNKKGESNV